MTNKRKDCPMRHKNGNCTVAGGFCTAVNNPICEALHNAFDYGHLSALRQQETVTNRNGLNEPLTLDELRQMDGEPVWLVNQNGGRWVIMSGAYLWDSRKNADYGKTWLAYLQKPEEGTV